MSHIAKIETKLTDLFALRAACNQLGFQFIEGAKTYAWYGRWVGDTKLPEGLKIEDLGKCDHAIHVPGAKYEVGVVRTHSGYELRWDYWQSGGLMEKLGGQNAGRLVQAYSIEKTKREAARMGQHVKMQTLPGGFVKAVLQGGTSW